MDFKRRRLVVTSCLIFGLLVVAKTQTRVPVIWDDAALADWAAPVAALNVRPGHYTAAQYYAAPAENLRTYPIYRPDKEPPGYWEELKKKKPEPLVDASNIRTKADWIAAGARAFRELDNPLTRSDDPALIAMARDPKTFENVPGLPDGTVYRPRWVVTDRGVMLTNLECGACRAGRAPGAAEPGGAGQTRVQSARCHSTSQWQSALRHACARPASPPLQPIHGCHGHPPAARAG